MLSQLLGTTPCGIVAGVPGLSQMTRSRPWCVSAAWDGFISSVLASSNHPRQCCGSVGSVVPQSRGSSYTSIVFSTLDLANYIQFILYFMHLLCNAHNA